MYRISKTMMLIQLVLLLSSFQAWGRSCPSYLIHFINMELSFVAPPVPVEDNAIKVFSYKSCEIQKFVNKAVPIRSSEKASTSLSRIKVKDSKSGTSFVIMQNEKVVSDGAEWSFEEKSLNAVLNEIYKEADKVSKCQKCLAPGTEKKLLRKYGI